MTPDTQLVQSFAELLRKQRPGGDMRSPGERFRYSSEFRRAREAARGGGGFSETIEVLSQDELTNGLRRRTLVDLSPFYVETAVQIASVSLPSTLLSLIDTIPVSAGTVPLIDESSRTTPSAGGTPFGVPAQEQGTSSFVVNRTSLQRWSLTATVASDVLEDQSLAQRTVNDLLETSFRRALEVDILTGDGSIGLNTTHLQGILNTTNLGVVATRDGPHSSETNYDAIARAVNQVQDANHYDRPLSVAAHPDALFRTRTAKTSTGGAYFTAADVVPDVKAWVPATTLASTQGLVGDFSQVKLFVGAGVSLDLSNGYQDYMTRGLVLARLTTHLLLHLGQPSALTQVTAL